ncbi:hypothetical protein GCM10009670_08290 [Citricoccus alkalitolerans]
MKGAVIVSDTLPSHALGRRVEDPITSTSRGTSMKPPKISAGAIRACGSGQGNASAQTSGNCCDLQKTNQATDTMATAGGHSLK